MAKTVQEIKKDKSEVEQKILGILKELEASSKIQMEYVEVEVDRHSHEEWEEAQKDGKKLRQLKGVLNVIIQLNLENDSDSLPMRG